MNYLKNLKWDMIAFSLGCIAMGILLAFFPQDVEKIMSICLAVLMFIYAIRHTTEYFRRRNIDGFTGYELVLAVIFLVLGIVCLTQMDKLITLLAYFIAAIVLVSGLLKIEGAFDLKRMGSKWIPMLVIGLIFILIAIVFFIYPPQEGKDKGQTLVAAAGFALMFVGVVNFITTLAISGKIKRWMKTQSGSPKVIDVEYEDVDENK
ncbi:MAG: DUF308 domain-containing protein [Eubacterium sp.]|nr:DUF308 domain-containing protein [Eubacterium sp.]